MASANLKGARLFLEINNVRDQEQPQMGERQPDAARDAAAQNPVEKLVELLAVPPAVEVALPQPQGTMGNNALVQPLVVDLNVPRPPAVDCNANLTQQLLNGCLIERHTLSL